MSDWIKHDSKGMPVDGETLVHVRFGDGAETDVPVEAKVGGDCWKFGISASTRIVEYKIVDAGEMA
jgi:hypothetical protein